MESSFFNVTHLCGRQNLTVWDDDANDFGECFLSLALVCPAHILMAITSAYCIGRRNTPYYIRTDRQKWVLYTRALATLVLAASPAVVEVLQTAFGTTIFEDDGISEIAETFIQIFSWLVHFMYVIFLLDRISPSIRGRRAVLFMFVMAAVVDCIQCRSILLLDPPDNRQNVILVAHAITQLVCLSLYCLTLLPAGDDSDSQYEELLTNESTEERQGLLQGLSSHTNQYGGFHEDMDPEYLGVAKEHTPWLSRLFLYWVNPLVKKGRMEKLKNPDDVFDVPPDLSAPLASEKFQQEQERTNVSFFLRALYNLYGREFFLIGILKFLADCAGFASPILLNLVVNFMEDKKADIRWGYFYAFGLAASTFVVAMTNTHFNLYMSELKLKVRAVLVTAVYRHTLAVSSVQLTKFSGGEVINYMSTDADRVVNFCPSLHATWSLPFQLAVTILLLYQQVGISSLVGVFITILMIPLNMFVANKIGTLSTKMMLAKDGRVQTMSELLRGIRVVKYFGWESYFASRVEQSREKELKYLKGRKYLDAVCVYLWATTPVFISVLTFATYALLGNQLTAAKVFTSVALFAMLTGPLNAFPWALNGLVEAWVSIKRIRQFLATSKIDRNAYFTPLQMVADEEMCDNAMLALSKCQFAYNTTTDFKLDKLSFTVSRGEFVGIIGRVGSGKSSLLAAVLGELQRLSGQIGIDLPATGIGYVRQEPWLQQGTVRDNILFGKVYQDSWYDQVVEACALKEDFAQLSSGDLTNVGEHGVMLSGGQKARVCLARAVYQDKDIYLVDDIFSALDVPVGLHIYRKCILGLLRNKTRIICTHHPRFLSGATTVMLLEGGKLKEAGAPHKMLNMRPLAADETATTAVEDNMDGVLKKNTHQEVTVQGNDDDNEETREVGVVKFRVYKSYWLAVGVLLSPGILVSLACMQASRNFTDVWLAQWVGHSQKNGSSVVDYYLEVYCSIAVVNSMFSLLRAFLFAYGGICAAKTIHEKLLHVILRGKALFFDTTPLGRILNRFSSDLYTVDDSLPFILNIFLAQIFGVVGPIIVCAYAVPWISLVLVPLAFCLYDVQARYRPASRDLKRIGSISLSPIYAHFSDTLSGLTTIRAMKATRRFVRENEDRVEASQKAQYAGVAAAQWLELRLQLIGCGVVTGIAVIAVIEHHASGISPGLVGLAISYALGITSKLSGLVSAFTETERELVAVERCSQFIDGIQQEDFDGGVTTTPYSWPTEGVVRFKDVSFRYNEHLPLALRDLSFETKAREKVGVVGRTGSGKSSIFQVLFRTAEVLCGTIQVDGMNLRLLNLAELRSHLTIIPQDPFLFSGTVRENLDPMRKQSDDQLWSAVRKAHLGDAIESLGGLDCTVEDRGRPFSVGQQQLLCLARAIVSAARIVCVDEATANVDLETDRLVQEVLRTALCDCTVITVAHRVETVIGSDRVIVMASGQAVEIGHPNILLRDPESEFSRFVAASSSTTSS